MRPATSDAPDLDQIREALQKIAEIIHDDERPQEDYSVGDFTTVDMNLSQVADLIPRVFPDGRVPAGREAMATGVVIEDLYAQLSKGKVVTTVGRMVGNIDEDLLSPDYGRLLKDEVSIPLNMVVTSVRPDELMKRTSSEERDPDLKNMPNLFSRPELENSVGHETFGAPAVPAHVQPASPPPPSEPDPEPAGNDAPFDRTTREESPLQAPPGRLPFYADEEEEDSPVDKAASPSKSGFAFEVDDAAPVFKMANSAPQPPASATEPVSAPAPEPLASAPEGAVLLGHVDLNRANPAELAAQLDGVGSRLAERIVRFREQHGAFGSVADLARVPGVGPTTFEKITGQPWTIERDGVRRALDHALGDDPNHLPDLRKVAERLTSLPGVQGCLFTHQDGYSLAENWDHPSREILGVVTPQIFKKVLIYADQLELGELNPVTLLIGDHAVSVIQTGEIFMSMIHSADQLGKNHMHLLQLIGAELDVRMEKSKSAR